MGFIKIKKNKKELREFNINKEKLIPVAVVSLIISFITIHFFIDGYADLVLIFGLLIVLTVIFSPFVLLIVSIRDYLNLKKIYIINKKKNNSIVKKTKNIYIKISILISLFIISIFLLYKFSFLNGFFSFFFSFLLFGLIPLFLNYNKTIKDIYKVFYFFFILPIIIYVHSQTAPSLNRCAMLISECTYADSREFKFDRLIKKDAFDINYDWNPEDFLWGVYNDPKKQERI